MVTPLSERDTLDAAGLERLIEHILGGGAAGLFLLGTTGEGPGLSYRLRRELIERACRAAAGRVPVLVGVTDTAFSESVTVARHAAEAGADVLVLAPPYYLPVEQPELLDYLDDLLPELPLPLLLYNIPGLTKVAFEPETVQRLLDREQIIGIKDSSGDMAYVHRLLRLRRERPDWTVLVGPEPLLAEATLFGANGGVCGGANIHPRLYVDLYRAAAARDLPTMFALHERVLDFGRGIYGTGNRAASFIQGIKCALSCLGICDDAMAEPFRRLDTPERRRVRQALGTAGVAPLSSEETA